MWVCRKTHQRAPRFPQALKTFVYQSPNKAEKIPNRNPTQKPNKGAKRQAHTGIEKQTSKQKNNKNKAGESNIHLVHQQGQNCPSRYSSSRSNYGTSFSINTSYWGALPSPQRRRRVRGAPLNNGTIWNKDLPLQKGRRKKKSIYIK